ncbi:MAG: PEP-CTERM sorting domain-containing protein [Chlorobiaceae bacterium]|nr:PEP-CTERM sorting domain-containing protein [Chlorobiaceae bacterium]
MSPAPEPPIMVLLGGGALLGAYWLRKKSLISAAQTS